MYRPTTPNSARPGTARRALNLLILILATSLGWAGAQVDTFTAEDGSFSLHYPAAWTVVERASLGLGGTGFMLLSDPELIDAPTEEAFALVFGEVFANPEPGFAKAAVADVFGDNKNITATSDAVVTQMAVGKLMTQTFSGTEKGVPMSVKLTLLESGEQARAFVSMMNEAGLETLAPAIDAVMESFIFDMESEAGVDTSANVEQTSEAAESVEQDGVEELDTFAAEDGSFTLSYPAAWTIEEGALLGQGGTGFVLMSDSELIDAPTEEAFALVLGEVFANPGPGFAEAAVADMFGDEDFTPTGDAVVTETEAGQRITQTFSGTQDGVDVSLTLTFVVSGEWVKAFVSVMNEAGQGAYGPMVDTVLASFALGAEVEAGVDTSPNVEQTSEAAESVEQDGVEAIETFTAEDGSFTLSYPANWTMSDEELVLSLDLEGSGFTLLSDPELENGPTEEAFAVVLGKVFVNPAPGFAAAVVERVLAAEGFTPLGAAELVQGEGGYYLTQTLTDLEDEPGLTWTLTLRVNGDRVGAFISVMNVPGQEIYGSVVAAILNGVELADVAVQGAAPSSRVDSPVDSAEPVAFETRFSMMGTVEGDYLSTRLTFTDADEQDVKAVGLLWRPSELAELADSENVFYAGDLHLEGLHLPYADGYMLLARAKLEREPDLTPQSLRGALLGASGRLDLDAFPEASLSEGTPVAFEAQFAPEPDESGDLRGAITFSFTDDNGERFIGVGLARAPADTRDLLTGTAEMTGDISTGEGPTSSTRHAAFELRGTDGLNISVPQALIMPEVVFTGME